MAPFAEDYIEVSDRIREFKEKYPDGSLQSLTNPYMIEAGGKPFIVYGAAAYRTPDDPKPGIGWAWEPVPGPTPYTKDSELMNAETSAWGRAIVALGFASKKIASANEVRNRQGNHESQQSAPQQSAPDPRNTPFVPLPSGDDPGSTVIGFGKHKGQTLASLYRSDDDGASYVQWVAFKMEPKGQSGADLQESAKAFLQGVYNKLDANTTGDPGPADPGQFGDDDVPFMPTAGGDR